MFSEILVHDRVAPQQRFVEASFSPGQREIMWKPEP